MVLILIYFLKKSFSVFLSAYLHQYYQFFSSLFHFQVYLLLENFNNLYITFLSFPFLFPSLSFVKQLYMFLVSIQQNLLWPFHVIDFSLIQSLFYFFLSVMGCLIYNLRYQILFQHFLQCLCKCRVFYVDCKAIYIYIV